MTSAPKSLRSEEHTSELQSRGLISYAVFCLKKKRSPREETLPGGTDVSGRARVRHAPAPVAASVHDRTREGIDFFPLTVVVFVFFNDTATTEIYTLSLHDALPILMLKVSPVSIRAPRAPWASANS